MSDSVFYILAIIMAIAFRYNLQMNGMTLTIGKLLSDTDSPTGFQDAITPPEHTNFTLLTWVSIVILISTASYFSGAGIATFAIFTLTSILTGIFLQDKTKEHCTLRIYKSMVRRYADFIRNNDTVRAAALYALIDKFEQRVFKDQTQNNPSPNETSQ